MTRNGVLTIVLWAILVPPAFPHATGQRTSGVDFLIRGRIVLDVPVPPSERIEVRLERTDGHLIHTVYSDALGNFRFPGVLADIYFVRVNLDGFREAEEEVDYLSARAPTATVTIFLESESVMTRETEGGDVVDISELRSDFSDEAIDAYVKAQEAADDGDSGKAVELLETAVGLAPEFYQARNDLGLHLFRLGRYLDAREELGVAIELNPNTIEPLLNLGSVHLEEGERHSDVEQVDAALISFSSAVEVLEQAVTIEPTSVAARYLLGSALYRTDDFDRAETMLDAALTVDSEKHEARLMLVNVYMRQRRYEEVVELLSEYLQHYPDSPQREAVEGMKKQIEEALKPGH